MGFGIIVVALRTGARRGTHRLQMAWRWQRGAPEYEAKSSPEGDLRVGCGGWKCCRAGGGRAGGQKAAGRG